jgi:serine/threonine protein phosphatase PrpC
MYSIYHWVHTEAGRDHINEDAVLVRPHPEDGRAVLCCLADGQGGQVGGAIAAQVAVTESIRVASSFPLKALLDETSWYGIVSAADEAVCEDDAAGYTTLISLCLSKTQVCGASCGDSGALLLNGGREWVLTESQRKNPPVGSSAASPVAFSARLQPGWKLLLMSDGVWRYIGWEIVIQLAAMQDGETLITSLREAALNANGGKLDDDFSVALLQHMEDL